MNEKIVIKTNIAELKPEDYPIFDDLFALIKEKLKTAKINVVGRVIKNLFLTI